MSKKPGSSQRRGQDLDEATNDLMRADYQQDVIEPHSGSQFFGVVLAKSNVKSPYNLIIPSKLQGVLGSRDLAVVLTCRGKSWKMDYLGQDKRYRRLSIDWKHFVHDNNLRIGDACAFELLTCDNNTASFKVQILRGELHPVLLAKIDSVGESSSNPITIE